MRRRAYKTCSTLVVLLLSGPAWAQVALKPVYVESFRKGPTQISEYAIVAKLDTQNPYYNATIKDLDGNDRYQLSLEPHRVGQGDDKIVSWRVQLIDPRPSACPSKLRGAK